MNKKLVIRSMSLAALALALSACGGDDNDGDIDAIEDRIISIEERIDALDREDNDLSASLDAIEVRLDALDDQNNLLSNELADILSLLEALEARLDLVEPSVYKIELVNVTANQPIAPAAVVLHSDAYYAWDVGAPASLGLERLAESGAPTDFIDELSFALDSGYSEGGPIAPGGRRTVYLEALWQEGIALTIAGMPVNTNDAFSGTTAWNIAELEEGMTKTAFLPIYDAGTEANTETIDTVPGPAAGGEGFNPARDDLGDYVTRHPGVVSADDGLSASALNHSHRFDQSALYVSVTRLAD